MNTIILSIKKKIRLLLFILNYFIESLYIFYIESLGHPYSSKPFLSGDSFRSISKNIYESKRNNIQKVSSQASIETIFIESHLANELNDKPLEFNEECILILHNSDDSLKEDSILLINPKIKKIFAQNINFYHPTVTPIPIGLEKEFSGVNCSESSAGLFLNDTLHSLINDTIYLYNNSKGYLTLTELNTLETEFYNLEFSINDLNWNINETLSTIILQRILTTISKIQKTLSPFVQIKY